FVMLRLPGTNDPLLGRPFALYDTVLDSSARPVGLDIVYLVVGKMTGLLTQVQAGNPVEVWGPLGNGFPDLAGAEQVACVAGGIGQTPFLAYACELLGTRGYGGDAPRPRAKRVSLYYGVRTAAFAAGVAAGGRGPLRVNGFTASQRRARLRKRRECWPSQSLIAIRRAPGAYATGLTVD